eukprot:NODE_36_length_3177_cov_42.703964_g32_i0.p1 GENE.NODE_36_length_3177_cov_42.703964_g32_i0~~NODE_36_length_3177_cov_42.703964_g32_i0.p1  ORF type:complete len:795 (+),score=226.60 NODE_36_length_3177_cov_42.703964_g32_i0:617-3001(+)
MIDYERICDRHGRVVKFGPFAGYAGVVDTLHALGISLLARGYATPFLHISTAKKYRSLENARADLLALGDTIRSKGLPEEICPLTFVVTGMGSVSTSAQQMLHNLPCIYVDPSQLKSVWERETVDRKNVYVAVVGSQHMVKPKEPGKSFDSREYYRDPTRFVPTFHENIAPYTRVLINGMYWEPRFPRLLSTTQAKELHREGRLPLMALGDITCDPEGSIEFFTHSTTIGNPLFCYDMEAMESRELADVDHIKDPIVVLGVDHLPAEFPCEASQYFGDPLHPLVKAIAHSNGELPFEEQNDLPEVVKCGVMTCHGKLTPSFEYINELRKQRESTAMKQGDVSILVLGAGMMAGAVVEQLLKDDHVHIVLADMDLKKAQRTLEDFVADEYLGQGRSFGTHSRVQAIMLDIADEQELGVLVQHCDLVISLLPAPMHPMVAPQCLKHSKSMLTTSYIGPQMEEYSAAAEAKGLVFMNELGLDPGLDIMSSLSAIRKIRQAGGEVESYESYCGVLPGVEFSDNPIGYKFSWNPAGVLSAATRPSRWRYNGKEADLPGKYLYNASHPIRKFAGLNLFGVPNGDYSKYEKMFGLEKAHTLIRGTLRYGGFAQFVRACNALGLLESTPTNAKEWAQLFDNKKLVDQLTDGLVLQRKGLETLQASSEGLRMFLNDCSIGVPVPTPVAEAEAAVVQLRELGLGGAHVADGSNRLGVLCDHLQGRLRYAAAEQDFVLLHQQLKCHYPSSNRRTLFTSQLIMRGQSATKSSTAITVGTPIAVAAKLLLRGEIKATGVCRPMDENV